MGKGAPAWAVCAKFGKACPDSHGMPGLMIGYVALRNLKFEDGQLGRLGKLSLFGNKSLKTGRAFVLPKAEPLRKGKASELCQEFKAKLLHKDLLDRFRKEHGYSPSLSTEELINSDRISESLAYHFLSNRTTPELPSGEGQSSEPESDSSQENSASADTQPTCTMLETCVYVIAFMLLAVGVGLMLSAALDIPFLGY